MAQEAKKYQLNWEQHKNKSKTVGCQDDHNMQPQWGRQKLEISMNSWRYRFRRFKL